MVNLTVDYGICVTLIIIIIINIIVIIIIIMFIFTTNTLIKRPGTGLLHGDADTKKCSIAA